MKTTSKEPTYREIAGSLGVDVRTAYQHVRALERKSIVSRHGKQGRIRLNPVYRPERGVPILGRVPAGPPSDTGIESDRYLELDHLTGDDVFALDVRGDSMLDSGILDGDLVVVRSQATADDGQIVVASIDDEYTVKTLRVRDGQWWLCPENSRYEPIQLREGARLLGRVLWIIRKL